MSSDFVESVSEQMDEARKAFGEDYCRLVHFDEAEWGELEKEASFLAINVSTLVKQHIAVVVRDLRRARGIQENLLASDLKDYMEHPIKLDIPQGEPHTLREDGLAPE